MSQTRFRRLFIANRGEIARRIALGAQAFGIESVALYSGEAPPAFLEGLVSSFIKVPEESPAVYLNAGLMVELALQAGCDAVHPGFGFLSENAAFAELVESKGLKWIGPSPSAISRMASKAAARAIAKEYGVPVVPGLEKVQGGSITTAVSAFAREFGFPILLKAAMGGGGKGMRVVRADAEIEEAVNRAQSEALSSFGDETLIVERYVEHPRHIEVQILGDQHGNVYALGDRDCSVQRRHQKIIEEAPAPNLRPETRARMQEAAVALAKGVGYSSAGTVEFIMDWSAEHRERQDFFFLEMNTRLQVEHPVTEQVFGVDLVLWQLRIAAGESLKDQLPKAPQGHSIELRIYAEDCANGFLPAPGPVHGFLPYQGPGIRWESGIDAIDEITPRFDPMIAKLIATGGDRRQAIQRLIEALRRTVLAMPISNLSFLLDVLQSPGFADEQPTTRYIEEQTEALRKTSDDRAARLAPLSESIWAGLGWSAQPQTSGLSGVTRSVFTRAAKTSSHPLIVSEDIQARVPRRYGSQTSRMVRGSVSSSDGLSWTPFAACQTQIKGQLISWLNLEGHSFFKSENRDEGSASGKAGAHAHDIVAPVPGKVVKIMMQPGAAVKEKQTLLILESMKMEFEVKATRSGVISEVFIKPLEQVQADAVLAHWQDEGAKA